MSTEIPDHDRQLDSLDQDEQDRSQEPQELDPLEEEFAEDED